MQNDLQNKYELKKEAQGVVEIKHLTTNEVTHKKVRQKVPGKYCAKLIDPITELLLAEIQGESSKAKLKKILLYEPDDSVELKDSGRFGFEYKFRWENEKFVWKKRAFSKDLECKIVQSGEEPNIPIALYQPKNKNVGIVNIMSDNMIRLDIKDRRGLEYVLLMSLLSFLDKSEDDSISKEKNEFILGEESKGALKEELKKLEDKDKKKREKEKKKNEKQTEKAIKELTEEDNSQKLKQEKMDEEYAKKLAEEQKSSLRPPSNYSKQTRPNSFSSSSPSPGVHTPPSSGSNSTTYHDDNTFQSRKQKLAKNKPKEYKGEYGW
ncbi:939_t:CDS:2 [Gigaspora margarita]|uniref:939_t:CDS:1 n=1 Tax=Gigaspora margarita TaxID=4874 RepID=A0ABN7V5H3_GIGMA|nr:939_t:CDS:2 [Gigaspora margarita]